MTNTKQFLILLKFSEQIRFQGLPLADKVFGKQQNKQHTSHATNRRIPFIRSLNDNHSRMFNRTFSPFISHRIPPLRGFTVYHPGGDKLHKSVLPAIP